MQLLKSQQQLSKIEATFKISVKIIKNCCRSYQKLQQLLQLQHVPYGPPQLSEQESCGSWCKIIQYIVYVRIKLRLSSYKMFVVKGNSFISSHQYAVQHFYKVFSFIPILFPFLPLCFHFSVIFFYSILYFIRVLQLTHAVLDSLFFIM